MTDQRIEVVRRAYAAWSGDVEAYLTTMDLEVEFTPLIGPVEGSLRGHEDVRRYFQSLDEVFPERHAEPVDFVLVADLLVAQGTFRARGRGSGVEISQELFQVVGFRDGRIAWFRTFRDRAAALEFAEAPD